MARNAKETTDAVEILHRLYVEGDPEMEAMVEEERINAEVARKIYDLRKKAGLSQRQLAARVGTTASVICRLEDADYEGHSLTMLRRIADALDHHVQIRMVKNPCAETYEREPWMGAATAAAVTPMPALGLVRAALKTVGNAVMKAAKPAKYASANKKPKLERIVLKAKRAAKK